MGGAPKMPRVSVPTAAEETPPPPPPSVPPALPPPAKDAPAVQGAEAAVRRTERRRGRVQTILTSPMGVTGPGKATLGAIFFMLAWLVSVTLWAASPEEMLTITSGAVVSPSTPLCRGGTTTSPSQSRALIMTLDANVYFTLGGSTPSASFGGVALPNTTMYVDHATDIRLIAVSSTARAYVLCLP